MNVVLDTNVLISSLFWRGNPRRIVDAAVSQQIQSVTSFEILEEFPPPQRRISLSGELMVPITRHQPRHLKRTRHIQTSLEEFPLLTALPNCNKNLELGKNLN